MSKGKATKSKYFTMKIEPDEHARIMKAAEFLAKSNGGVCSASAMSRAAIQSRVEEIERTMKGANSGTGH